MHRSFLFDFIEPKLTEASKVAEMRDLFQSSFVDYERLHHAGNVGRMGNLLLTMPLLREVSQSNGKSFFSIPLLFF